MLNKHWWVLNYFVIVFHWKSLIVLYKSIITYSSPEFILILTTFIIKKIEANLKYSFKEYITKLM